ncbi:PREDICTED: CD209 antigen-like protein C [Cyprinodon variegatus]|uniref:CD209 antigen-like protein C n=1 Tax=Cyprinodon variegatus TaxID=28743 RepID=UPI0007425950|nr:PREDICTED: CD209 antigen-like protein C [Cyprinodon variegatus]
MEEIYVNVEDGKPVCQIPTSQTEGSSSYKKKPFLIVIIFLGILSVLLLVGLIVLGLHSWDVAADLSNINDNLTDRLQESNSKLYSMTEERNLLHANLTEMMKKLNRPRGKTCPTGWTNFSCSCYFRSTVTGSWDEGRQDCLSRGADLVVIKDKDEQDFISRFAKEKTWIGLNDKETEGSWKWVDGTSMNLSFWIKDQPDNGGGDPKWGKEDCAHVYAQSQWNDLSCAASLQWICKKLPPWSA